MIQTSKTGVFMLSKFFPFRILVPAIAITSILSAMAVAAADNSKEMDMSQLTCGEFLQLGRMETMMSIVWYSGWIAEKQGEFIFTPERSAMSDKKNALETACNQNKNDLVLNQLHTWIY